MQCGSNDQHKDYLRIDYSYLPPKAHVYQNEVLVKKWSVHRPLELINKVIDGLETSGFEKIKIKATVKTVIDIFEPKNIKIIQKEKSEQFTK